MSSNFTIFPFDMLLLKSFPLLNVSSSTSTWDVLKKKKNPENLFFFFFWYCNIDVINHKLTEKQAGEGMHFVAKSPCITTGTS